MLIPICAYLVGAIPSGFLVARLNGIRDIRQHGSGNIGATNIARVLGLKFFFLVLFLDASKAYGFLYLVAPHVTNYEMLLLAAGLLLVGNGSSIFLRGQGGKGVATGVGVLLALYPLVVAVLFSVWLATLLVTRTVGLASIVAMVFLPFYTWYVAYDTYFVVLTLFISVWGLWLHRRNIQKVFVNYWCVG